MTWIPNLKSNLADSCDFALEFTRTWLKSAPRSQKSTKTGSNMYANMPKHSGQRPDLFWATHGTNPYRSPGVQTCTTCPFITRYRAFNIVRPAAPPGYTSALHTLVRQSAVLPGTTMYETQERLSSSYHTPARCQQSFCNLQR